MRWRWPSCRASAGRASSGRGVLSRRLIHQTRPRGSSPVGSPIHIDRVSKAFSDAVENIGRNWGDKTPPTFHEIRSLSERLHAEQGNINTQDLLGHKAPRTTQTYHDSRGDWVRVKVGDWILEDFRKRKKNAFQLQRLCSAGLLPMQTKVT